MTSMASPDEFASPESVRLVDCPEYEIVDIELKHLLDRDGNLSLNPEVEKGDFFAVSLRRGKLRLHSRGFVGFIPVSRNVVVHVRPRVPVSNLTRIAGIAGVRATVLTSIRQYETRGSWNQSVADVYTSSLLDHLNQIVAHGLLREYFPRNDETSFPRGRIQFSDTLRRFQARGNAHKAAVVWFERTPDNAINRCIKYAMWALGQHYEGTSHTNYQSRRVFQQLAGMYSMFDGVKFDSNCDFAGDPQVLGSQALPSLRSYYRPALDVAMAIVTQKGLLLESSGEDIALPSIVINMNELFEEYVRRVLTICAEEAGWEFTVLDGNTSGAKMLFNREPSPQATPDVVIRDTLGEPALILEIKNVPAMGQSSREAINQAVTYAVSFRAKGVVLVHPCNAGQESGLAELGVVDKIHVYQYRYDLGQEDLAAEDAKLFEAVASLVAGQTPPFRPRVDVWDKGHEIHTYGVTAKTYSGS